MSSEMLHMIGRVLDYVAEQKGNRIFLCFEGRDYSYNETKVRVDEIAKALLAKGIGHGDHVAVWLGNSAEWIFIELALHKIGAVLVGLNTRFHVSEAAYALRQSDSKALVFQHRFLKEELGERVLEMLPELNGAGANTGGANTGGDRNLRFDSDADTGVNAEGNTVPSITPRFPVLELVIDMNEDNFPGTIRYDTFLEEGVAMSDARLAAVAEAVQEDDPALLVYTSGTTGDPKGVLMSQRAIFERMHAISEHYLMNENDRTFFALPLFHTFGCVYAVYMTLISMSRLCLMEKFRAHDALQLIQNQRCTVIDGVPSTFQMMFDEPDFDSFDLTSGRTGVLGGAPSSPTLIRKVKETLCPTFCNGFGQTETIAGFAQTDLDDSDEIILNTNGKALPGNEVVIKDPETGLAVPVDTSGEICVRCRWNMLGYYKMPEATHEVFDDEGFLHTGDLGYLDEDGYIHLSGRLRDMIIIGGINIYPIEIENKIAEIPGISGVQVVGKKDERLGEVPVAFVMCSPGGEVDETDIIEHCKKELANYKVPRQIMFMTEFPMTVNGKVQKYKLRESVNGTSEWREQVGLDESKQ